MFLAAHRRPTLKNRHIIDIEQINKSYVCIDTIDMPMNLQQLEYVIAVDTWRHFATAAEKSNITQPTLSMMIRKLEEELGVQIFDRSHFPVVPTEAGVALVEQARVIVREVSRMREVVNEMRGELKGELKIGIIPTVAPYLLPLFLREFVQKHPLLKVKVSELTTESIIEKLRQRHIDAGILATPLMQAGLRELPLYYEEFVVYASHEEKLMKKKYVLPSDIDTKHLWLMEEGHCLRSQVLNLCELRTKEIRSTNLEYEAGSIETLMRMVELNNGVTIIPEMALSELSKPRQKSIRRFKAPFPTREISIVTYQHFVKQRMVDALQESILDALPPHMVRSTNKRLLPLV